MTPAWKQPCRKIPYSDRPTIFPGLHHCKAFKVYYPIEIIPEAYTPAKREVLKEIWDGFVDGPGEKIKQFVDMAAGEFLLVVSLPYVIPSYVRAFREVDKTSETTFNHYEDRGGLVGILGGVVADSYQLSTYMSLYASDHPEVILIPAATNAVSLVYEVGRKVYKNARARLIDRHSHE